MTTELSKWYYVNILNSLVSEIRELVREGRFASVPSFVESAVREKLDREKGLIEYTKKEITRLPNLVFSKELMNEFMEDAKKKMTPAMYEIFELNVYDSVRVLELFFNFIIKKLKGELDG